MGLRGRPPLPCRHLALPAASLRLVCDAHHVSNTNKGASDRTRKAQHKIRIATRSGAVAVSYRAYQRVATYLVKCNTVWAARKVSEARRSSPSRAIAAVSAATGLQFVRDANTDEAPDRDRDAYQPDRYGDRWAPVLVAWAPVDEVPDFGVDVAGEAMTQRVTTPSGDEAFVTGAVLVLVLRSRGVPLLENDDEAAAPADAGQPPLQPSLPPNPAPRWGRSGSSDP